VLIHCSAFSQQDKNTQGIVKEYRDMMNNSETIMYAQVISKESKWHIIKNDNFPNGHREIYTLATFKVFQWIKGSIWGDEVAFYLEGGQIGDTVHYALHSTGCWLGERAVFFLRNTKPNTYLINNGRYEVFDAGNERHGVVNVGGYQMDAEDYVKLIKQSVTDAAYKYWMTVGFMPTRDGTLNFNYSFSLGENFYKVDYIKKENIIFGGFDSDGFRFNSCALSIGRRFQSKWFQANFFAGPAYVYGKKYININKNEKFRTAGLQMDAQLLFRLANEVGFGVGLFANLNFIKNFTGFDVNITLGNGK
jgi:hypothetical protein